MRQFVLWEYLPGHVCVRRRTWWRCRWRSGTNVVPFCVMVIVVVLGGYCANVSVAFQQHRFPNKFLTESLVLAEEFGSAMLPCDIDTFQDDSASIVRWYKDNATEPFYILEDAQKHGVWNANHDIDVAWMGRAFFSVLSSPATLTLTNVTDSLRGIYHCHVTFHSGLKLVTNVTLNIGVSPSQPIIYDGNNNVSNGLIGPHVLGHVLNLVCIVRKGRPKAQVLWRRNGIVVDASRGDIVIHTSEHGDNIRSILSVISGLKRSDLDAVFSCEASNEILESPRTVSATLDLYLPPLKVEIETTETVFENGESAEFVCRVVGCRPFPVISWHLEHSRHLEAFFNEISDSGNETISRLRMIVSQHEDGATLGCHVTNMAITSDIWQDTIEIRVKHDPIVNLRLGNGLQLSQIVEENDVYFECAVSANPPVTELIWNPEMDTQSNVIREGHYLIIRNITRHNSGPVWCQASNSRTTKRSDTLMVDVKYPPKCSTPRKLLTVSYTTNDKEPVVLRCHMDANPWDSLTFSWRHPNGSMEKGVLLNGTTSVLFFHPPTGSNRTYRFACSANNSVESRSSRPCVVTVEPFGVPQALEDCRIVNKAINWFTLECFEKLRKGEESYLVEVFDSETGAIVFNTTSDNALFYIRELSAGTEYVVNVYAFNQRGRSTPNKLVVQTVPAPSNLLTQGSFSISRHAVSIFTGWIIAVAAIVSLTRLRSAIT